ncbi:hypothetical protein PQX77_008696 [Marasmius sp. AFHP31]|nr:hypothetical protein PQX77_008696 [Marasmius sp. AFHP31]
MSSASVVEEGHETNKTFTTISIESYSSHWTEWSDNDVRRRLPRQQQPLAITSSSHTYHDLSRRPVPHEICDITIRRRTYRAVLPRSPGSSPQCQIRRGELKLLESWLKSLQPEQVIQRCGNPRAFRIFSPDELVSTKLDATLEVTSRNLKWDVASRNQGGHVIEILSAVETSWRQDVSAFNYLETSTWTRQKHNGFSHQNLSFLHWGRARSETDVYEEEAERQHITEASTWRFKSTDSGVSPVVIVGIGIEMKFEVVAAAALPRKVALDFKVRVVNVTDLMMLGAFGTHLHALSEEAFEGMFTKDREVHFNDHGHPIELKGLLFGRPGFWERRVSIEGYREEGVATSPFEMMVAD